MMTETTTLHGATIAVVAAYVAIAVLLLSLNLASRWRWWIKGLAIVVTTGFFAFSYVGVQGMIGWPSEARVPPHFQLHWATIVEPDKFMGDRGAIYLWIEELDDRNMPTGVPRSHRLPYTKDLAEKVMKARERIESGMQQAGSREDVEGTGEEGTDEAANEKSAANAREGDAGGERNPDALLNRATAIDFHDLPPPILERKPGL